MEKVVNEEVYNKVKRYIQEDRERYTFEKILQEKNLLENSKFKGDSVTIECPFHVDESPSCGISLTKKIFNCFSCGRGGSYLKFVNLYKREIEGINIGMYSMVNSILAQDKLMQSAIGASTIWKDNEITELDVFKLRRPKLNQAFSKNALEHAKELKMKNPTQQEIFDFVLKLQSGMSIEEITKSDKGNVSGVIEDEELVDLNLNVNKLNLKDFL